MKLNKKILYKGALVALAVASVCAFLTWASLRDSRGAQKLLDERASRAHTVQPVNSYEPMN